MKVKEVINGEVPTLVVEVTNGEEICVNDKLIYKVFFEELGQVEEPPMSKEEKALEVYISNPIRRKQVIQELGEVISAWELAYKVVKNLYDVPYLTEDRVRKQKFYLTLLPFAHQLKKGRGPSNLYKNINEMLCEYRSLWNTRK